MKRAVAFLTFALCVSLVVFSRPAMQAAQRALTLWWEILLPTLFPFFAGATLMERAGALQMTANLLYPVSKKLRISYYTLPILIMGMMSGYPAGARLCGMLLSSGDISDEEGERLATICTLCSPMFLMGAVAGGMFKNNNLFVPLAVSYYAAALLVAVGTQVIRPVAHARPPARVKPAEEPLYKALPKSIADGMADMLKVGGSVVFFLVLAEVFGQLGIFGVLGFPLDKLFGGIAGSSPAHGILLGLMEITGGCNSIVACGLPVKFSVPLCAFLIGFGGLCVMVQAMGFVPFKKPGRYLVIKLCHGTLAGLIAYAMMTLSGGAAETFAAAPSPYWINTLTGLALLFACGLGTAAAFFLALIFGVKERRTKS